MKLWAHITARRTKISEALLSYSSLNALAISKSASDIPSCGDLTVTSERLEPSVVRRLPFKISKLKSLDLILSIRLIAVSVLPVFW